MRLADNLEKRSNCGKHSLRRSGVCIPGLVNKNDARGILNLTRLLILQFNILDNDIPNIQNRAKVISNGIGRINSIKNGLAIFEIRALNLGIHIDSSAGFRNGGNLRHNSRTLLVVVLAGLTLR